ncbi:hypothetical protein [Kaistella carnis]|uniref:hypothetical protein n=1 Tax=Kaistella carnis TaxID=1241979 RepID=UPI0028B19DA0|nr:hypothetical protein [Kaistella carnis]
MKNTILLLILTTGFFKAQKLDYKFLTKDQNNEKWYYAIDKEADDGFHAWVKAEYTFDNDPSTESTEYYIEFKCSNKSMSDEIVKINWRKADAEITKRKMPFGPVSKNHISYPLFKKFCK